MTDFTTAKYVSDAQMNQVAQFSENATKYERYENIQELEGLTGHDTGITVESSVEEMKIVTKKLTGILQKQLFN